MDLWRISRSHSVHCLIFLLENFVPTRYEFIYSTGSVLKVPHWLIQDRYIHPDNQPDSVSFIRKLQYRVLSNPYASLLPSSWESSWRCKELSAKGHAPSQERMKQVSSEHCPCLHILLLCCPGKHNDPRYWQTGWSATAILQVTMWEQSLCDASHWLSLFAVQTHWDMDVQRQKSKE